MAILREMSRGKVAWWGSSDPRVSAAEIARRVGVNRSTVRARVRKWQADGFLRGVDVMPNPSLFGVQLGAVDVCVADVRAKRRVLEDFALVDGALFAIDHVGSWLAVNYATESQAAGERRARLVARLPGVAEVSPCYTFGASPCELTPSPLDWRILEALRRGPARSLEAAAREVGVSARTFHTRLDRLIRAKAVWSVPKLDFTRYVDAVFARFIIQLEPKAPRAPVAEALRKAYPDLIELSSPSELPGVDQSLLDLSLHLESVGAAEAVQAAALGLPGVAGVEALFPLGIYTYPAWVDERVAQAAASTPPPDRAPG